MTVVFTDLAGFTTISEKLQERTVPLLNDYMSRMMPIIRRHNGRWNKFLGDGIMFFFNAPQDDPDHARNAVVTVLEMLQAVEDFNKDLFRQQLPRVAMRAGIVTGNMVVGDSGSMDPLYYASDYTVLGDNVNLSARLESANKALGSRILCVEQTIKMMGPGILYRPMALLQVVGKTQGVMTYEPLCFESDATTDIRELAQVTRAVVESYVSARFDDCLAAVTTMQERFGSSKFTKIYLESAREFAIAPPGEDFDGTIILEAK
jgi:adenylate cyclase